MRACRGGYRRTAARALGPFLPPYLGCHPFRSALMHEDTKVFAPLSHAPS